MRLLEKTISMKIMKALYDTTYFCLLISLIMSCNRSANKNEVTTSATEEGVYEKVSFKAFDTKQNDVCQLKMLEFTDIYGLQGLPDAKQDIHGYDSLVFTHMPYDSVAIERMLKDKGLSMVNMRWGKWAGGPKIACLTYADNSYDCCCHVDKVYYATEKENEYIVTERIDCFGPSGLTALNQQTGKHVVD
jgi:hypothetical protein